MSEIKDSIADAVTGLPFDVPLPNPILNVEEKSRSNLFSWRGQFTPQLVEALIHAYAPSDSFILDPFAGSGTVLMEAGLHGMPAAGYEVNPAAALLAQTYTFINEPEEARSLHLRYAERALTENVAKPLTLFQGGDGAQNKEKAAPVADRIKAAIDQVDSERARQLLSTLAITVDFAKSNCDLSTVWATWSQYADLVQGLPFSESPILLGLSDARSLPLQDSTVDFVLTSPPYINVFNYHQNYRASAEALGWKPLKAARTEIGANRKFRQNRLLTVIQYCLDLTQVFLELRRVCKPTARIIFIVGRESNVRKTPFYNGKLLLQVAVRAAGLESVLQQERVFSNRFGRPIYEDILHLTPSDTNVSTSTALEKAREIAADALMEARDRAPAESMQDLRDAIEKSVRVKPSPPYKSSEVGSSLSVRSTIESENLMEFPTPHLEKLNAALENDKVPKEEIPQLEKAVDKRNDWIRSLRGIPPTDEASGRKVENVVSEMVSLLDGYKRTFDLEVIFDSPGNFLYRQKGQLKLDNTIIEEFLPYLVVKAIPQLETGYKLGPTKCYSSVYFTSSLGRVQAGGGPQIRYKDQDFAISKRLYIKAAHTEDFADSIARDTFLGYITAECKTNLDKTMFQEATATARDVKSAVPGAKYFLLCEWLDMTPVSTAPTDIDEVLVLRKAKRVSSHVRKNFSSVAGRTESRSDFAGFLRDNPYRPEVFMRLVNHIIGVLEDEDPAENEVLDKGFF